MWRCVMGRQSGWLVRQTGRPAMRSPGRPPIRRDVERAFWVKIAEGLTSEDAAIGCGVSGSVGSRWFRERGGMPTVELGPSTGRYLSFSEREEIALLRAQGFGVRAIARRSAGHRRRSHVSSAATLRLGERTSSIGPGSRDGRRSWLPAGPGLRNWSSMIGSVTTCRIASLVLSTQRMGRWSDRRLRPGRAATGPADRIGCGRARGALSRSRTVAGRLPDDESMRISHEAIYQALYIESRGALKRELVACLRTGRSLRVPRARAQQRPQGHVTDEVMISERPPEADDRAVPGHWEAT